jgi:Bacterial pre-peptidase C-terminal domain
MHRSFGRLLALVCLLAAPHLFAQCGVERWSVKTGTDADKNLVNLTSSTANTITTMRSWTAPSPIPANNRVSPYETTQWVLNATLTQYKLESDSDYHLVLSDASGNTMIAEIPAPNCVGTGSVFAAGIQNSRNEFDAKYTATTSFQTANIPVQIKGVGMFDFLHGQTGVAPNGIEIHAVLDIIFNPTTNPDFTIASSPISVSVVQGSSGTSAITTAVSGGFNSSVVLTATGLPTGAGAGFSPSSIAAPGSGSSTLTLTTSASTPAGSYPITVTGTGGGKTHSTSVTLVVTTSGGGGATTLTSGQPVTGLSGALSSWRYFKITVPSSQTSLAITTSGGTGDEDIYVKLGAQPTSTVYDYRSIVSGNTESVTVTNPAAGDWYIGMFGYAAYSGVTLTATYSGGGGGSQQLIVNPGFETGTASPWVATTGIIDNGTSEAAHSGSWKAWLDGYGAAHTDSLYQQVSIPSTATSANLTFWLHIDTAETGTTAYDTLKVQVRNSSGTVLATLATYSNTNAATGFTQKSFSLLAYKGQTVQVYLVGVEDSTLQTSFVVDDFALNVQ